MNVAYSELAKALRARRDIIADRDFYRRDPAAHLDALKRASETIGHAAAKLPGPVDPQLEHFLSRASFDKALAFIEQMG